MAQPSFIVLCNDRIAIPALRVLAFQQQLYSIVVPARNRELIEELKEITSSSQIPLLKVRKENWQQQTETLFGEKQPAAGLIMTFPWKLDPQLLTSPPRGFLNFHYGSLPAYRGSDPLFYQIRNRESFAGLCIHKAEEDLDTGDIVMDEKLQLNDNITYGMLKSRLSLLAASMVEKLSEIMSFSDRIPCRPQAGTDAAWYGKPAAEDVIIKWKEMDARSIIALINACNPWNKGAVTLINGLLFKILEAEISGRRVSENISAGQIVLLNSGTVEVATLEGQVLKLKIIYSPDGFMDASRLSEYGIKEGDQFS